MSGLMDFAQERVKGLISKKGPSLAQTVRSLQVCPQSSTFSPRLWWTLLKRMEKPARLLPEIAVRGVRQTLIALWNSFSLNGGVRSLLS